MVVGALSFFGARLSAHLHGRGHRVVPVESILQTSSDPLWWYRKQQLAHSGLSVLLVNMTNQSAVWSLTHTHKPKTLVYTPPGCDGGLTEKLGGSPCRSHSLKEFVNLLEEIRTTSPCTSIMLLSVVSSEPQAGATRGAWVRTFELTLSTYHHLYAIPVRVLRMGGVYGPWQSHDQSHGSSMAQCWYVSDVVKVVSGMLEEFVGGCEVVNLGSCGNQTDAYLQQLLKWYGLTQRTSSELGLRRTRTWTHSYIGGSSPHEDVVFSSYFTSVEDSQRKTMMATNRFRYMQDWLLSAKVLGLSTVVFHDGLAPDFQWRLQLFYSKLQFQHVPSLEGRSTNDARFYAYLKYLEAHSEIRRVLLTDISDVKFQRDPFELMSQLGGDHLYIGTDIDYYPDMASMRWLKEKLEKCYGVYSLAQGDLSPLMKLHNVYNAGVIGGTRHLVLALLARVTQYLDISPGHLNCNMAAVNYAVHKHFFECVFTGFPLTSRFQRRQFAPKGVYIIHK